MLSRREGTVRGGGGGLAVPGGTVLEGRCCLGCAVQEGGAVLGKEDVVLGAAVLVLCCSGCRCCA